MPENESKTTRVDRFIYTKDDVKHIFKLGDIGKVFGKTEENRIILLKKILMNNKK